MYNKSASVVSSWQCIQPGGEDPATSDGRNREWRGKFLAREGVGRNPIRKGKWQLLVVPGCIGILSNLLHHSLSLSLFGYLSEKIAGTDPRRLIGIVEAHPKVWKQKFPYREETSGLFPLPHTGRSAHSIGLTTSAKGLIRIEL